MAGEAEEARAGAERKCQKQSGDERPRDEPTKPAFRNRELGNNPARCGGDTGSKAMCKGGHFLCGQAVEKEVRDDQVVWTVWWDPFPSVCVVNGYATCVGAGVSDERTQHGAACIDRVDVDGWIYFE